MESNPGVNIEDTQYAICKGTYGGKTWSATDRDAACKKYEQMTGKHVESGYQTSGVWNGGLGAVIVVVILAAIVVFYLRKSKKYPVRKPKRK